MKIVLFMASRGLGGLEKHVADLAAGLAGQHDVVVVAPAEYREALDERVRLVPFPVACWRLNPVLLFRLAALLKREKPDIIHAHANKAVFMISVIRAFFSAPTVGTVHGVKKNLRAFEKMDAVIAVSKGVAKRFAGLRKVFVVPNGIAAPCGQNEARSSVRQELGWAADEKIVLAVGRLAPVKGFDLLIRAFKGQAGRLVIVGEGPQRPALECLIKETGQEKTVQLLGYRNDVPTLMRGADLMAISSHREGFPYVAIESLLVGLPMVSTRVPGLEDYVPDQFLIPAGQTGGFAALLTRALADLPLTQKSFEPVFAAAQRDFTLESMIKGTLAVYRGLLEKKREN